MEILENILSEKGETRIELIQKFQNYIWNEENLPLNKKVIELLRDLAYDLDFCETDKSIEYEIKLTLKKIEECYSYIDKNELNN